MATKLSQLDNSLGKLAKKIEKSSKDYVLFAIKQAERIFKDRLFNDQGGRATDESLLPRYSKGYLKHNEYGKRKTATHWDLSATHDLEKSIKPFVKKDTGGIRIARHQLEKANDLEKRSGKIIFTFSKTEMKEVIDETVKQIKRDIDKMTKESFK